MILSLSPALLRFSMRARVRRRCADLGGTGADGPPPNSGCGGDGVAYIPPIYHGPNNNSGCLGGLGGRAPEVGCLLWRLPHQFLTKWGLNFFRATCDHLQFLAFFSHTSFKLLPAPLLGGGRCDRVAYIPPGPQYIMNIIYVIKCHVQYFPLFVSFAVRSVKSGKG